MNVSEGLVIKTHNGGATVQLLQNDGCGACPSRDKCKQTGHMEMQIEVPANAGLAVNDRVLVSFSDTSVARISMIAYLLPVICLIAGGVIGNKLDVMYRHQSPVLAALLAVIGFMVPLVFFYIFKNRINSCPMHNAHLEQILK